MYAHCGAVLRNTAQNVYARPQIIQLAHDNDELGEACKGSIPVSRLLVQPGICIFAFQSIILEAPITLSHVHLDAAAKEFNRLLGTKGNRGNQMRQPIVLVKPLSVALRTLSGGDGELNLIGLGVHQQRAENRIDEPVLVEDRTLTSRRDKEMREVGEIGVPHRCAIHSHDEIQDV